jgi:hypothetical protein
MPPTLFPALPDTHFKVWSFNRVVIFKHLLSVFKIYFLICRLLIQVTPEQDAVNRSLSVWVRHPSRRFNNPHDG